MMGHAPDKAPLNRRDQPASGHTDALAVTAQQKPRIRCRNRARVELALSQQGMCSPRQEPTKGTGAGVLGYAEKLTQQAHAALLRKVCVLGCWWLASGI